MTLGPPSCLFLFVDVGLVGLDIGGARRRAGGTSAAHVLTFCQLSFLKDVLFAKLELQGKHVFVTGTLALAPHSVTCRGQHGARAGHGHAVCTGVFHGITV